MPTPLRYGDRVRVNGASGQVISRRGGSSVTVETRHPVTGRSETHTLTGYDQVFRRRLDSFESGKTPTYALPKGPNGRY
jgi:hypothetical protein